MRRFAPTLLLVTFFAIPASADESDRLFKEGTDALEKGQFAVACPKLAEARKIDPKALGILVNLARCNEEWNKTATAYAQYGELEKAAKERKQNDRVDLAQRRRALLTPKLSRITVKLAARAPGETVQLDGAPLAQDSWDNPLLLDPGPHELEASAKDRKPWSHPFELLVSANDVVNIPDLESTLATPAPIVVTPPPKEEPAKSNRGTIGLVVGGAGVVVLGVGAFFGIRALSKKSDLKDACPNDNVCAGDLTGPKSDYDSAKTSATISTIAIPVGAVALGVGAFLFFTSPKSTTGRAPIVTPLVGRDNGGLSVSGLF